MSGAETGGADKIPVLKRSPGASKKTYQFRHSDSESDSVSSGVFTVIFSKNIEDKQNNYRNLELYVL